ncbi:AHH domain-containing protein [Novosphingobium sp. MW5]|nr:AHH domain-containing protein [Novosphingobium sp. MW5]
MGQTRATRHIQTTDTTPATKPKQVLPCGRRPDLPFRAVNRQGSSDYNSALQRHHLLPLQLLSMRSFLRFFESIGLDNIGFDDFRRNGLLLPCSDATATMMALPMHRGPHHRYNAMAIERVARIEQDWRNRGRSLDAGEEALFRLALLQGALRRRLLDPRRGPIPLNRNDPALRTPDFSDLDAMADMLWGATEGL